MDQNCNLQFVASQVLTHNAKRVGNIRSYLWGSCEGESTFSLVPWCFPSSQKYRVLNCILETKIKFHILTMITVILLQVQLQLSKTYKDDCSSFFSDQLLTFRFQFWKFCIHLRHFWFLNKLRMMTMGISITSERIRKT